MRQAILTDTNMAFAYYRYYEFTDAEKEEIRRTDFNDPDQLERYYDLQEQQYEVGLMITTLTGEVVANVDLHAYFCTGIFALSNGGYGAVVEHLTRNINSVGMAKSLVLLNEKGEIVSYEDLSALISDLNNIEVYPLPDGNYLYYGNNAYSGYTVYLLDPQFNPLKKLEKDAHIYVADGKYYMVKFDGWDPYANQAVSGSFWELNTSDLTLSSEKALSPGFPAQEGHLFADNGKLYTDDGEGLCSVDILTGERERILLWGDTDVFVDSYEALKVVSSEDIYLFRLWDATMIHLKKEATNPHAGKRILRVGVNDITPLYYREIVEYNKRPESQARVYIYYPNSNNQIYDLAEKATAADKLLLDMRSGDGPDILMNYSEFGQFDNEEVLLDLNPYIDGDKGIDRSQYYNNVFRAFETDGKLFELPLSVMVTGLVGNPDLLGNTTSWTCDEYLQKINGLPDGVFPLLFSDATTNANQHGGTEILLQLLYSDFGHYVDYSKYEVYFDSDDFRKLLEIAKRLDPHLSSETYASLVDRYGELYSTEPHYLMVQDGVSACTTFSIRGLHDLSKVSKLCHNDSILIGIPTMADPGLSCSAQSTIGISAFSEVPDIAWDFVRFFISAETQNRIFSELSGTWGISVCRESQQLAIQSDIKAVTGMQNQETYDQDLLDRYEVLIEGITHRIMKNPSIVEIIREEAPAYFEGHKTVEEVSKTIQDRASRVLQELE